MVNNEFFGEVIWVFEEKSKDDLGQNYVVFMIDFFFNFEGEIQQDWEEILKLIELVFKVLGVIWGQAMMKESDLVGGLFFDYILCMIFFFCWEGDQKDFYFIFCGLFDGFGGFFSWGFCEYDFELGCCNCQSFLCNYFCIFIFKVVEWDSVFWDWDVSDECYKWFYSEFVDGYFIVLDMNFDC